jgi:hypothetical protein
MIEGGGELRTLRTHEGQRIHAVSDGVETYMFMEKGFLLRIRFKASYFASLTRACRIRTPAALAPRRIVAASLAFAGGAEAHLVDAWRGNNIDCCRRRLGIKLVTVQTRSVIPVS